MMGEQRSAQRFPLRLDGLGITTEPSSASARALLRPQIHLQHAAADASRRLTPSGVGLDSDEVRRRMVDRLRRTGIQDEAILAAMAIVPRHQFVDSALVNQAYEDTSLPIGCGQTISKPSVVARMIELLRWGQAARATQSLGRVLEIGTGCGYQAAVLSQLSLRVLSVERVKTLYDSARVNLDALRNLNTQLVYGDGMLGFAANAPYESIIVSAGGGSIPKTWLDQLASGGRLVAPQLTNGDQQILVVVDNTGCGFKRAEHGTVCFVPLHTGLD